MKTSSSWNELIEHAKLCKDPQCCCSTLVRNFNKWSAKLLIGGNSSSSWFHFTFNASGKLRWACLCCNGLFKDPIDNTSETQLIQFQNLLKHHESHTHRARIAELLGDEDCTEFVVVPPKELFKELFHAFQKGDVPTGGYELLHGLVGFRKAMTMMWCIDQSLNDGKRFIILQAELLNLIRDERHGRMHVRFRAANREESATHARYLGQSRHHQPDAIGLTEATVKIFKNISTSRANCPVKSCVPPHFDKDFFNAACDKVEAISIDSAENEVVSANDMKDTGCFKNCTFILRDSAHSARRIMSRLWKADSELDYNWKFFMLLATLIQWSGDLRTLYTECCSDADDGATSSNFSHMRAAKHRIETWLSPLSRSILEPSGPFAIYIYIYEK
jgi:hypothetical protein